ncbi:MAG: hypothetical protein NW206_13260 [Hyphomonadaceae bacterium]|nr:hypothetical protein [Hyphomonadaceae bacterium]
MMGGALVRLFIYAAIALVVLGFIFVVLLLAAMLVFGVALVRADVFALLVGAYWILGAPAALLVVYRLANRAPTPASAPQSET